MKAWRGSDPFWNARVHFFEVLPLVIERSTLLRRQLDVFDAAQQADNHSQNVYHELHGYPSTTSGRFMLWVQQHMQLQQGAVITHRLVMQRGNSKIATLNLCLFGDDSVSSLLKVDRAAGITYPLFEVVQVLAGQESRARMNFCVELFAVPGQEWDNARLSQIMEAVVKSIRSVIQTTSAHRLYLSTRTVKKPEHGTWHDTVLIHSNIVVLVGLVSLIEPYLVRELRSLNDAIEDLRWESIIDPTRESDGSVMARMLHTALTERCPQFDSNDDRRHTSEICAYQCCHGWVQKPSNLRLRYVFRLNGARAKQEKRELIRSSTLRLRTLTIHCPVDALPALLRPECMWIPLLPHQLQWHGGHLQDKRISEDHQTLIHRSKLINIDPDGWESNDGYFLPDEHLVFQNLQKACQDALMSTEHVGMSCRMLSIKVRFDKHKNWNAFLLHLCFPAFTKCCVSDKMHQESYQIQIFRNYRYLNGSDTTRARCNHWKCIGKERAKSQLGKRKHPGVDNRIEKLCKIWTVELSDITDVNELENQWMGRQL